MMGLSNKLIKDFVELSKNEVRGQDQILYGRARVINGNTYVQLDGSELETPVLYTASVKDGDRVMVLMKNHTATIIGNVTSPTPTIEIIHSSYASIESLEDVSGVIESWTIPGTTKINGGRIETGTITADKLDVRGLSIKNDNDVETLNIDDSGDIHINSGGDILLYSADRDESKLYVVCNRGEYNCMTKISCTDIRITYDYLNSHDVFIATHGRMSYIHDYETTFNVDGDDGTCTTRMLRLLSTYDASETSSRHAFQIGEDNSLNVKMDNNELIALNDSSLSPFYLNASSFSVGCGMSAYEYTSSQGGYTSANNSGIYVKDSGGTARTGITLSSSNVYNIATGGVNNTVIIGNATYTTSMEMRTKGNLLVNAVNLQTSGNIGSTKAYTSEFTMYCKWKDNEYHNIVSRQNDGLTCYFGWAGSSSYKTVSVIRAQTVKYQNASGTTTLSDERLKTAFMPLDDYDDVYMNLIPYAFQYKSGSSGRFHFGFKAQQVRDSLLDGGFSTKDFAGFVQMEDDPNSEDYCGYTDPMGIIYTEITPWNTHMIQKCIRMIQELKTEVLYLKSKQAC